MHNSRFGEALAEYRDRVKLSQRAAAQAAGISESKWRQLEAGSVSIGGERVPTGTTPRTAVAAAHAVNMPARDALELIGENPDDHPALLNSAPQPIDDHVPGFAALTPRQRDAVVELVASMLDTGNTATTPPPIGAAPDDLLTRGRVRRRDGSGLRREGGTGAGA